MTMPPPEPDTHCWDDDTGKDVWSHSPDQMRAYGEACAATERERCAKLCTDYARHHARNDDDTTSAQAWMMLQCAAAIRAQGETP